MQQKDNIENKLHAVICDIRQNLGLSPDDPSMDDAIAKMSRKELFCRFMTWNGIMGFESFIKCALSEIYNVEFEEGLFESAEKPKTLDVWKINPESNRNEWYNQKHFPEASEELHNQTPAEIAALVGAGYIVQRVE